MAIREDKLASTYISIDSLNILDILDTTPTSVLDTPPQQVARSDQSRVTSLKRESTEH